MDPVLLQAHSEAPNSEWWAVATLLKRLRERLNASLRRLQEFSGTRTELTAIGNATAALDGDKPSQEDAALSTALSDAKAVSDRLESDIRDTRRQLAAVIAGAAQDADLKALRGEVAALATTQGHIQAKLSELTKQMSSIQMTVGEVKDRLSYTRHRWDAIDKLADYLVVAQLPGDYCEFGVYEGRTFGYAYKRLAINFPKMRFAAFDSFQGLPMPRGRDALNGYTGGFAEGQFACTEERFRENIAKSGADMSRVTVIAGWFQETLSVTHPVSASLGKVSAAWIDCDLYESTPPILDFLTRRLSVGSVLLFDDWRCFRNLPDFGEQRACAEWLVRNPDIRLNDLFDFGFGGKAFTVATCPEP